jgi:hypothetical protein
MRSSTVAVAALVVLGLGCTDVRDFRGSWRGPRVGDTAELRVGVDVNATATLAVEAIDKHGFAGRLSVDGLVGDVAITSIPAAEADVLAGVTFDGAPLRVYLAFVPITDGGGDAFAVIAMFDARVELRLLRGGARPIYAIFALAGGAAP